MADTASAETSIRRYIEDQFLVVYEVDFTADTNLFQAGIMDSFGYIQLVEFLQETFDIQLGDDAILGNVMVSQSSMLAAVQTHSTTLPAVS